MLKSRVKSRVKTLSSVLDVVSLITGSWWIKSKLYLPIAGHHHPHPYIRTHSHVRGSLCMLCNACLLGGRGKQPWQRKGQTGSLLMGGEWRGGLEERRGGSPCWSWLGQQERLLLALIGSLHRGEVHGVSVVLSHPLAFLLLFLSSLEGAVMGHWSGLMAMSFWFFLSFI